MDLAAQDRWSQGQANLYLGIVAESSAELWPRRRISAMLHTSGLTATPPSGGAVNLSRSLIPQGMRGPRSLR